MTKIRNTDNTKGCQGCGATGTLIHCWWECKVEQPLWKIVWWFLTQITYLPHDSATTLLGIYPKEFKTDIHTNTYTQMFIVALLIIAKTWKQQKCPSVGKWIHKL